MPELSARIRVLIVDDHAMFRQGLRALLEAESDVTVVGEAQNGVEAVRATAIHEPDVVLLDVAMPGISGLEVLRLLSHARTSARVILLSVAIPRSEILKALKLGARGVVVKESAIEVLLKAIRAVRAGEYWVGPDVIADLVEAERLHDGEAGSDHKETFGLTARELEIVGLVAAGCSNREIAERCGIREDTVKHHLSHIFDKTGMSTRVELALFAVRNSLVSGT